MQTEDRFNEVKDALKTLDKLDLDKLIVSVCRPLGLKKSIADINFLKLAASEARESSTAKIASARVAQMLNLRSVVKNIPLLAKALTGCRSQLLQIVRDVRGPMQLLLTSSR